MRTAHSSSHWGAPPSISPLKIRYPPLEQAPPLGAGNQPGTRPPPRSRHHPPVNRMTNGCKNITLPQTSFAGGYKSVWTIHRTYLKETNMTSKFSLWFYRQTKVTFPQFRYLHTPMYSYSIYYTCCCQNNVVDNLVNIVITSEVQSSWSIKCRAFLNYNRKIVIWI